MMMFSANKKRISQCIGLYSVLLFKVVLGVVFDCIIAFHFIQRIPMNLIKEICKEYGLTHKELGEEIGYSGETIRNLASKPNESISVAVKKALFLFKENRELKKEIQKTENFKNLFKEFFG